MLHSTKIYCLLLLMNVCISNAQNISGRWIGKRTSGASLTLDIQQCKDSIFGTAYIIFPEEIGSANVAFSGNIQNGILEYETTKILEQNVDSAVLLCLVTGRDILKIKKRKQILEGACISIDKKEPCFNLSCIERYEKKMEFTFHKNLFLNKKVLIVDTIWASQDSLDIKVWDNLKEDGDIVSIYLNEQNVLEKYTLKHQQKTIKLACTKTYNNIVFYAHNVGSEAPNTASIGIYQNGKLLKEIVLKSDAEKSESFVILRSN